MSRGMRITLYVVGGLAGVIALSAAGLYASSESKLTRTYDAPLTEFVIPSDSATIERGKHLSTAIGKCAACHDTDLGGKNFIDDPSFGVLSATNLTKGGVGANYTDAEMIRAIRHGVKNDGTGARMMPSDSWQFMTDDDVVAIVAYIRSLPPVVRELKPFLIQPLGRALVGSGALPMVKAEKLDHSQIAPKTIAADTTVEYGKYLSEIGGCTSCHGPGLSGGVSPTAAPTSPPASNLTPTGIGAYSDEQIEAMLRTGKRPDGSIVNEYMPWTLTALLTPTEMRATIKYLRSVPPKEFGNQ